MSITLSDGTASVNLPADLFWSDEFTWSPVEQTVEPSVTGALIVQVGTRQAGRPITLQPPDTDSAWMTAVVISQLQTWAGVAGLQLQITLRGITRTVIFRHQDGALSVDPIAHFSDVLSGDFYTATVRFMEYAE